MTNFGSSKRRIQGPTPATSQESVSSFGAERRPSSQETARQKEELRQRLEQIKNRIEQSPEKAAIILTEWLKNGSQTKKSSKRAG